MRAILLASFLTACSSSDAVYAPAGASTWNDGYPAATVPVPSAGTLEVASFGLIELTPADLPSMSTLHVRLVAAAQPGARPWRLDLPAATVRAGAAESRALLANGDLATLPVALVEPGRPVTLDVYFALPPGVQAEEDLAELDLRVPVVTTARTIPVQVHFTRREQLDLPALRAEPARVAGWGPQWWADPQYAWGSFHRRSGVITPRAPASATVNRLPRWQRPR